MPFVSYAIKKIFIIKYLKYALYLTYEHNQDILKPQVKFKSFLNE